MTARIKELEDLNHLRQFVFCTASPAHAQWLSSALRELGVSTQERGDAAEMPHCLASLRPVVAFIDFAPDPDDQSPGYLTRAVGLAKALARLRPDLPLVAVGQANQTEGTLAALRAGVRDFIDLSASVEEIREVVERVTAPHERSVATVTHGKRIVILGARAGVGSTTLATHLAALVCQGGAAAKAPESVARNKKQTQDQTQKQNQPRVMLLDLGLPVGDGLLYLNESGNFHFAEAVRNLQRFDETLVQTGLTHSSYGVTVMSLPRDLSEMRMISHADSLALLNQLRRYFDVLITDLGGFSSFEFVANMVQEADETWLVTDQSIGSIVSLADLLNDLAGKNITHEKLRLVVNRYDERYGMSATQIAERFSLRLAATVPDRPLPLLRNANLGQLLLKTAEQDPYVRAVRALAESLQQTAGGNVTAPLARARFLSLGKFFPGR